VGGNSKIVVTGGAGYIGKITCHILAKNGFAPVILDNFCSSPKWDQCPFPLHEIDLCDLSALQDCWKNLAPIDGISHFAAHALVQEACEQPEKYFRNNFLGALNLVEVAASGS